MDTFDTVILGAGAAGLMCALTAGGRGRRVLLIDQAEQPGAKILISGGGRCNFTNLDIQPDRFLSANPHFCKSALSRYRQQDFIALVERHGIAYHEKTLGQLFCDGSARAILDMLLAECRAAGVELRLGRRVTDIAKPDQFRIETDRESVAASSLILATGGLSIPKMGATGFAHDVARRFGLGIVKPRPGLVPFTAMGAEAPFYESLAGVAADAVVGLGKRRFKEAVLFTHRGLSGPAILQISSYWREGESIEIDLVPEIDVDSYLKDRRQSRAKAELKTVLGEILPQRLAQTFASDHAGGMANLPDRQIAALTASIKRFRMTPAGTEGWAKAEVTLGGIDTGSLSSKTMEARDVPGLYAIGEAVDVTGWLGGYNFQWAWSSGWCAGQAV
jgi:predicted Rossmann fold flavoprotein